MYGQKAGSVVLPATGLGLATSFQFALAVLVIAVGFWLIFRKLRSPHHP